MFEARGSLACIKPERVNRVVVFGDIHGDLDSFEEGLTYWGDDDLLVLLGDYADRGPEGVEVIEKTADLMNNCPDRVIALQGNHEVYTEDGDPTFAPCTLIEEVRRKRGAWKHYWPFLSSFFSKLFLSALFPGHFLFVHGGIHSSITGVHNLESPRGEMFPSFFWSDPGEEPGERSNTRGIGTVFGPDVSKNVLDSLGVATLLRSHEPRKARKGPVAQHEGRIVTTSSTTIYGGKAFILTIDSNEPLSDPENLQNATRYL
jgi:hypothetical protein